MITIALGFPDTSRNAEPEVLYTGHDFSKALKAAEDAPEEIAVARVYRLPRHQKQINLAANREMVAAQDEAAEAEKEAAEKRFADANAGAEAAEKAAAEKASAEKPKVEKPKESAAEKADPPLKLPGEKSPQGGSKPPKK